MGNLGLGQCPSIDLSCTLFAWIQKANYLVGYEKVMFHEKTFVWKVKTWPPRLCSLKREMFSENTSAALLKPAFGTASTLHSCRPNNNKWTTLPLIPLHIHSFERAIVLTEKKTRFFQSNFCTSSDCLAKEQASPAPWASCRIPIEFRSPHHLHASCK